MDVVKHETARVNIDILGINELKWTGRKKKRRKKKEKEINK